MILAPLFHYYFSPLRVAVLEMSHSNFGWWKSAGRRLPPHWLVAY